MADRNRNRSDSYQIILLEHAVSPFILNDLSAAQGMNYKMRPDKYDEEYLDLREKLKKRMWELIEDGLTTRQKEVVKLSMEGFTQNEIAKQLGINQTSVHKVLRGNIDYSAKIRDQNNNSVSLKKRYGGAFKKITKLCQSDPEIQNILKDMLEVQECLEL